MHRGKSDRILNADEVNLLVRHYTHLDHSHQAAEEWWAGAVALDHSLEGLPRTVEEIATTNMSSQHRWRAWLVNTQSSKQLGSHWSTVVASTEMQMLHITVEDHPMASSLQLLQSTVEEHSMASSSQLLQSTAKPSAASTVPE